MGIAPGTPAYNQFLVIAQSAIDSADPINHASFLAESASTPIHLIEVVDDEVIPNSVSTAPLSGTDPLVRMLNLQRIGSSSSAGGAVTFTEGNHGSLLDSSASPAATQEMQQQAAAFALSRGIDLPIVDTSVIQAQP